MLVTKYRRKVITKDVLRRLQEIFEATCTKWRCTLKEFNGEDDHVHLVISFPPDVQVSTLVGNLKTVSSRLVRSLIRRLDVSVLQETCILVRSFGELLVAVVLPLSI